MKKITFYLTTLILSISIYAQDETPEIILAEAQISSGTSTIKSLGGNFAMEGEASNIVLNSSSTEAFTFTKTDDTYMGTINGVTTPVAVWTIQTASGRFLQLQNTTTSSARLKHRGTTDNSTWYILEGNEGGEPFYIIKTAHQNHAEGEKFMLSTSKDDFLNTQTVEFLTNTRTRFTLSGLTRTGPLSTKDFDSSSILMTNPIKYNISIKGLTDKVKKVEVFNLLGKSIISQLTKGQSIINIDSSSLTSGIYLVKIYGENASITKKIIKE